MNGRPQIKTRPRGQAPTLALAAGEGDPAATACEHLLGRLRHGRRRYRSALPCCPICGTLANEGRMKPEGPHRNGREACPPSSGG